MPPLGGAEAPASPSLAPPMPPFITLVFGWVVLESPLEGARPPQHEYRYIRNTCTSVFMHVCVYIMCDALFYIKFQEAQWFFESLNIVVIDGLCSWCYCVYIIIIIIIICKGYIPGVFGTSHGALQFMAYEELKKAYARYNNVPPEQKLVSQQPSLWGGVRFPPEGDSFQVFQVFKHVAVSRRATSSPSPHLQYVVCYRIQKYCMCTSLQ